MEAQVSVSHHEILPNISLNSEFFFGLLSSTGKVDMPPLPLVLTVTILALVTCAQSLGNGARGGWQVVLCRTYKRWRRSHGVSQDAMTVTTTMTERTFRQRLFFLLLSLCILKGDCRFIEDNDVLKDEFHSFFNSDLPRETAPELIMYRRPLRCMDMVAVEGRFTFMAEYPQLSCAAFFMAEPNEVISLEYDSVDIDCQAGDFITVFDGWVLKGEKFPSSQDHLLSPRERYVDYCDSSTSTRRSVHSSQNVAMIFFRVHNAGSGFAVTFRKLAIQFPCNVISQSPEGTFTMVSPQQHRNCSFSIVYPVEVDISEFSSLGLLGSFPKWPTSTCDSEDMLQLLGGNGLDTSKMFPLKELCSSSARPSHVKVGCENTVVRMVSSGRNVNRVSFSYRLLDSQELQRLRVNNVEDFCSAN